MARQGRQQGLNWDRSGPWIGVGGIVVNLWLTFTSAWIAPWWGVVLLVSYLIAQAVLVNRWATEQPRWCIAVPIAGAALWLVTVLIGTNVWGWD